MGTQQKNFVFFFSNMNNKHNLTFTWVFHSSLPQVTKLSCLGWFNGIDLKGSMMR